MSLTIYENATTTVEIDQRSVRLISKWDNKVIQNPTSVTVNEINQSAKISVNGEIFTTVENFVKRVLY